MPAKSGFDPRKLMKRAIEVMRQSVHEPRTDSKASPIVGAVLYKPDGAVEAACRGELRYGDHAEFALLERKNRSSKLDGSILFVTLEPCAPDSRHPPKMSCSERIVLARIKEVWVGLADPDPTVDRKGIKYLQDKGVTIHMFDRDLQEVIQKENREFLAQAMERAMAVRGEKTRKITFGDSELLFNFTENLGLTNFENVSAAGVRAASLRKSRRLNLDMRHLKINYSPQRPGIPAR